MKYKTILETTDNFGKYIGRIVSKHRAFFSGEIFYLEVENKNTMENYKKRIAKSSMRGFPDSSLCCDQIYPIFDSLNFSPKGLEVNVQKVDSLLGPEPKKKIIFPREKFM